MRRTTSLVFTALCGLILLSGCWDIKVKLTVKPDGSGTIEEKVMLVDFFTDLGEEEKSRVPGYEESYFHERAADYGEDVQVVKFENLQENGKFGYFARFSFTDINCVKVDENFSQIIDLDSGLMKATSSDSANYINFVYIKGKNNLLTVSFPHRENVPAPDSTEDIIESGEKKEMSDEEFAVLTSFFEDMSILLDLEIKGKIVRTDASYVEKNTIKLIELNFKEILEDKEKFRALMEMEAATPALWGDYIQKEYPAIKYEPQDKVEIEFK